MKPFKRKITRYIGPDGKRCKSDAPGAKKEKVEYSTNYYGWVDGKAVPLCPDKAMAKDMLVALLSKNKMEEIGLADPYADHRNRPLLEHLADYVKYLTNKKLDDEYIKKSEENCRKVIEASGFKKMGDIRGSAVMSFLGKLQNPVPAPKLDRETYTTKEVGVLLRRSIRHVLRLTRQGQLPTCGRAVGSGPRKLYHRDAIQGFLDKHHIGIGPTTANHYLAAIKRFTRWLVKDRRIDVDYLMHVDRYNEATDLRHQRRAIQADLLGRLVDTAIRGKPYRGLTGSDRHFLYILAVYSGFRVGELASLRPESFDFDTEQPMVILAASDSKHREVDKQPLHPDVAKIMRFFLKDKKPGQKLWPGTWVENAAEMIRIDLAAAGIPYKDEGGRVFDFHALRGQFITLLVTMGAQPKNTQKLARHKNITLTLDLYTDSEMVRAAEELSKLPPIKSRLVEPTDESDAR